MRIVVFLMVAIFSSVSYGELDSKYDFQAINYLQQRDYRSLEIKYSELIRLYKKDSITDEVIFEAFNKLAKESDDSQEQIYDEWVNKYPSSYVALISRGHYMSEKAWRARGNKYTGKTPSDNMERFVQYSMKAKSDLLNSIKYDNKPILNYLMLILINGRVDGFYGVHDSMKPP